MLRFFGFTEIHAIVIEPTLAAPIDVASTEASAITVARRIAAKF
jgi:FMN-dependent NADH-azoreductase